MAFLKKLFALLFSKSSVTKSIDEVVAEKIETEKLETSLHDLRETPTPGATGKIRLGIIVGHTKAAPGAKMSSPLNISEYDYNTDVATLMADECARTSLIDSIIIYRDNIGIAGAYRKAEEYGCDAVIELHFNAYNRLVTGTETLCTANPQDSLFAEHCHAAMCKVFERGGNSRGVKKIARKENGGVNVHSFPSGVNCLVEPAFADNLGEANMLVELKERYASALVVAVIDWGFSVGLLRGRAS